MNEKQFLKTMIETIKYDEDIQNKDDLLGILRYSIVTFRKTGAYTHVSNQRQEYMDLRVPIPMLKKAKEYKDVFFDLANDIYIPDDDYDLYGVEIKQECTDKHKELNFDSLIDIMYCYRGELSHATKRAVYEEKQELVKPITLFISSVCFSVCGNIKVYCDKFVSEDTRKRRVNDHIQELEKRLGLE